jgi:hypothetical protein
MRNFSDWQIWQGMTPALAALAKSLHELMSSFWLFTGRSLTMYLLKPEIFRAKSF